MNFNIKNIILGTTIVLPAAMGLSISNADTIQNLTINSSVNFRVAPNTNSTKIDKLQKGQTVQYLGTSGNWYKVKYNGQTGYIYKTYASAVSTSESSNNSAKYVNCSSLNLRSGAGTNYSIIKVLYKGTNVTVLSTENNWSKVSVNGTIGYVSSAYLSSISTTSEDIKDNTVNETVQYYRYTTTKLNFRESNTSNSTLICTLAKNTKVGVVSTTSNGWSKIKYNGTYGYVNTSYLSSQTSTDSKNNSESSTKSEKISKIINIAKSKIGCSYVRGSEGPNTFDCSGLTSYLYKQIGITLPRGSSGQQYFGKAVSKSNLQPGDLVFLDTRGTGSVDHASIYIGNGYIIHANSTAGKVGISDLNSSYYKKTYVSARRVLD